MAQVPGWATPLPVPRFIVRVDVDEPGKAGTHGWQVRYNKPSRFFSDWVTKVRFTPKESLLAASEYLATIYAGPRNRCRSNPLASKTNPIQDAGLRLVEKSTRKWFSELYIEVTSPARGKSRKRVYVGTRNSLGLGTFTEEKLAAALERARQIRREMVLAHNEKKPVWIR